jgi:hypothetical protein
LRRLRTGRRPARDCEAAEDKEREGEEHEKEYGELLKFTLAGFAGGLILGAMLDWLGFQRSA